MIVALRARLIISGSHIFAHQASSMLTRIQRELI